MFDLKPLSTEAIPAALEKAMRYRLLNEPAEAESICLDVLEVDSENQEALTTLLLALTDRFSKGYSVSDTRIQEVLEKLRGGYERAYYTGIVCERKAKARLSNGNPGSGFVAYEWLREAMDWFERANDLRHEGNDDPILRWNACARLIMRNNLEARFEDAVELPLE